MTRKEAIKLIKDDMRLHHDYLSGEYRKALNMAISALEQPERKKGKWEKTYRNGFGTLIGRCGVCGRTQTVDNFCQNCGTDLREGEADD